MLLRLIILVLFISFVFSGSIFSADKKAKKVPLFDLSVAIGTTEFSNFKSPIHSHHSMLHLTSSALHLYTFGLKSFFDVTGGSNYAGLRALEWFMGLYGTIFLSTLTHEAAHYRYDRAFGADDLKLKVNALGFGTWEGEKNAIYPDMDTDIRSTTVGLHQQAGLARLAFERVVLKGSLDYTNSFIIGYNQMMPFIYAIFDSFDYEGDTFSYRTKMQAKGLGISHAQVMAVTTLVAALNTYTWQMFILAYKFIADGDRAVPVWNLYGIVAPPLPMYYLTNYGDLLEFTIPFLKPFPIFVEIGFGLAKFMFRLGVKPHIPITDIFTLIPILRFNYMELIKKVGYEVGVSLSFEFYENLKLFGTLSYSEFDPLVEVQLGNFIHDSKVFYAIFGISYSF